MGEDPTDYTDGYLQSGDIPNFRILDTSSGAVYDAVLNGVQGAFGDCSGYPGSDCDTFPAFADFGNLWSIDYDSSAGSSSKLRSSVGLTTQMWTPIGPVNFVLAQALSKAESDQTQSFKFQIGTSF